MTHRVTVAMVLRVGLTALTLSNESEMRRLRVMALAGSTNARKR
jgi:hypothetical protein